MIQVAFFKREGDWVGFEASGHAGYAAYGRDIVCAAVSAILETALGGLEEVAGAGLRSRRNDQEGYLMAMVSRTLDESARHDASVLIGAAMKGVQAISQQYPGFVRAIKRNRR